MGELCVQPFDYGLRIRVLPVGRHRLRVPGNRVAQGIPQADQVCSQRREQQQQQQQRNGRRGGGPPWRQLFGGGGAEGGGRFCASAAMAPSCPSATHAAPLRSSSSKKLSPRWPTAPTTIPLLLLLLLA